MFLVLIVWLVFFVDLVVVCFYLYYWYVGCCELWNNLVDLFWSVCRKFVEFVCKVVVGVESSCWKSLFGCGCGFGLYYGVLFGYGVEFYYERDIFCVCLCEFLYGRNIGYELGYYIDWVFVGVLWLVVVFVVE